MTCQPRAAGETVLPLPALPPLPVLSTLPVLSPLPVPPMTRTGVLTLCPPTVKLSCPSLACAATASETATVLVFPEPPAERNTSRRHRASRKCRRSGRRRRRRRSAAWLRALPPLMRRRRRCARSTSRRWTRPRSAGRSPGRWPVRVGQGHGRRWSVSGCPCWSAIGTSR